MQKVYKTLFLSAFFVTQISAQNAGEISTSTLSDNQNVLYNLALEIASLKNTQDKTTQALEELRLKLDMIEHHSQSSENLRHEVKHKSPLEEELELVQKLVNTQTIKYHDYLLAQNEVKTERDRITRENDKLAQKLVETVHLKEALENEKKVLEIALAYQKGPPEILIQKMQEVILACDELTAKMKDTLHDLEPENGEGQKTLWLSTTQNDEHLPIQQTKYVKPTFSIFSRYHEFLEKHHVHQTLLKNGKQGSTF
jgi:signal transduction histidine kinase